MNYFVEYSLLALTVSSATECSWADDGVQSHHQLPPQVLHICSQQRFFENLHLPFVGQV